MGRHKSGSQIGMSQCHDSGGNQAFMFTKADEIRAKKFCLDATQPGESATLYVCHNQKGNQYWQYDSDVSAIERNALLCVLGLMITFNYRRWQ